MCVCVFVCLYVCACVFQRGSAVEAATLRKGGKMRYSECDTHRERRTSHPLRTLRQNYCWLKALSRALGLSRKAATAMLYSFCLCLFLSLSLCLSLSVSPSPDRVRILSHVCFLAPPRFSVHLTCSTTMQSMKLHLVVPGGEQSARENEFWGEGMRGIDEEEENEWVERTERIRGWNATSVQWLEILKKYGISYF